jgi:hypothetical protein
MVTGEPLDMALARPGSAKSKADCERGQACRIRLLFNPARGQVFYTTQNGFS